MGQLISRAYRRVTQYATGGQSRDEQHRKGQHVEQQEEHDHQHCQQRQSYVPHTVTVSQSIPVGQSIDSTEYAALTTQAIATNQAEKIDPASSRDDGQSITNSHKENDAQFVDAHDGHQPTSSGDQESNDKPKITDQNVPTPSADNNEPTNNKRQNDQVEEAVIKIQAFVRGHLTRKALKDAHQGPNSLGQSQFDEESLTRNPPCAVFLPSSPLSSGTSASRLTGSQRQSTDTGIPRAVNTRTPLTTTTSITTPPISSLDSIAEDQESILVASGKAHKQRPPGPDERRGFPVSHHHQDQSNVSSCRPTESISPSYNTSAASTTSRDDKKLASISTRSSSSPSKLEMPPTSPTGSSSRGSASPVPSEACASIDLGSPQCDASASIDIEDHNIRQTDMMASVLHHRPQPEAQTRDETTSPKFISTTTTGNNVHDNTKTTSKQHGTEDEPSPTPIIVAEGSVDQMAVSAPLPEEAAAAVRIQSAFRKNSSYRTRSPQMGSSVTSDPGIVNSNDLTSPLAGKKTFLTKQRAANTLSTDYEPEDTEDKMSSEERSSRSKQRIELSDKPSGTIDVSLGGSVDESIISGGSSSQTTGEISNATIRDAMLSQQPKSSVEGLGTCDSLSESAAHTKLSADIILDGQPSITGLLVTDNAAGLNTSPMCPIQKDSLVPSVTSIGEIESSGHMINSNLAEINSSLIVAKAAASSQQSTSPSGCPISSSPPKSAASHLSERGNSFDTDSSALGAALSLNETDSMMSNDGVVPNDSNQETPTPMAPLARIVSLVDGQPTSAASLDEDKSSFSALVGPSSAASDEFEREARHLVDELAALEEAQETKGESCPSTGCQLTTEMDSDDIERRDPRGQVSLDLNRSDAQIVTRGYLGGLELVGHSSGLDAVATNQDYQASQARENEATRPEAIAGAAMDYDDCVASSVAGSTQQAAATASSSPTNDSDSNADEDAEGGDDTNSDHENEVQKQQKYDTKTTGARSSRPGSSAQRHQQQQQQQQQGGSKNKKKNRNKKNKARK